MIDLHIHTIFSDGNDTLKEILKKAQEKSLKVISITDHNTCDFYEELKKIKIDELYQGEIIIGCEFTTSFEGKIIEIIGYGFDFEKMSHILKERYNDEYWKQRNIILGRKLLNKFLKNNIVVNLDNCVITKNDYSYFGITKLFKEAKRYSCNDSIIVAKDINSFIRNYLYNPSSNFYLGYDKFYFTLEEVVSYIHNFGGLAFLAHPYSYEYSNINSFLNKICNLNIIDGIECFYYNYDLDKINFLLSFADDRGLFVCGGTDYHGDLKRNNLGIKFDVTFIEKWKSHLKNVIIDKN